LHWITRLKMKALIFQSSQINTVWIYGQVRSTIAVIGANTIIDICLLLNTSSISILLVIAFSTVNSTANQFATLVQCCLAFSICCLYLWHQFSYIIYQQKRNKYNHYIELVFVDYNTGMNKKIKLFQYWRNYLKMPREEQE
jgi:uncharacterized membrane protein